MLSHGGGLDVFHILGLIKQYLFIYLFQARFD